MSRTVRFDGNRADNPPHIPRSVQADAVRFAAEAVERVRIAHQPKRFYRATGHTGQSRPAIHIGQHHRSLPGIRVHFVGHQGRAGRRAPGRGFQHGPVRGFVEQHEIVEHVHQVNAPERVYRRLAGYQEILAAQRIGMQEAGPGCRDQAVENDRFHLFAESGDALHHTVGFAAAEGGIQQDKLTLSRRVVMAARHGNDLRRVARHGPRIKERRRPEGVAAVIFHLFAAVGIRMKQQAVKGVGDIGVFPAQVKQAPVVQHGRTPVVVLVVGQASDAPVPLAQVQGTLMKGAVEVNTIRSSGR